MDVNYRKLLLIQSSACIAETATYPIDYVKTKMQIDHRKTSFFDIARLIVHDKHKLHVYNGLKPALLRHCIYTMLRINLYENLEEELKSDNRKIMKWVYKNEYEFVDFPMKKYDPFFNINRKEDIEEAEKIEKIINQLEE